MITKEKTLEEQTDKIINETLEFLSKYNPKEPEEKRYNFIRNMNLADAFNKLIEIQQFMLINRDKYNSDKLTTYYEHVGCLESLTSNMNSLKYHAILHS